MTALEPLQAIDRDAIQQWIQDGNWHAIRRDLQPLLSQLEPDDVLYETYALACKNTGAYQEALVIFMKRIQDKPDDANLHLQCAICHQCLGENEQAKKSLEACIELNPLEKMAWHNLGALHCAKQNWGQAQTAFETALAIDPQYYLARKNLGVVFKEQKQYEQAIECFQLLIENQWQTALMHQECGLCYKALRQLEQAIASYQEALKLDTNLSVSWTNLGVEYLAKNELEKSHQAFEAAYQLTPQDTTTMFNLGFVLNKKGQFLQAKEMLEKLLQVDSNHALTYQELALVYRELGEDKQSFLANQKALAIDPNLTVALNNLGLSYLRACQYEKAKEIFEKLLIKESEKIEAYHNMASLYFAQNQFEEAIAWFNKALDLDPNFSQSVMNRGMTYLKMGQLQKGWKDYEARFGVIDELDRTGQKTQEKLWQGQDLNGKTIALLTEQGLGDTLQFLRYIPLLHDMGATICVDIQPELKPLFPNIPGVQEVFSRNPEKERFIPCDYYAYLMSLPTVFQTSLENIPPPFPPVFVEAEKQQVWREKMLPDKKLHVGLVWSGRPEYPGNQWRSVPFQSLKPLFDNTDIAFYSLQKGPAASQADSEGSENFWHLSPEIQDFTDTVAIMSVLDIVVTVDTSIAHLAGLMGKPVWILLSTRCDWRWLENGEGNAWYPSARLFRQEEINQWDKPIEAINMALLEKLEPTAENFARMAKSYFQQGNYQAALSNYLRLLDFNSHSIDTRHSIGVCYNHLSQYSQAKPYFEFIVERDPQHKKAWNNLGSCYGRLGNADEAIQCFQKAVEIDPNYAVATFNLADAYFAQDELEKSLLLTEKVLQLDPTLWRAEFTKSAIHLKQGDLRQGWPGYRYRMAKAEFNKKPFPPDREWQGESLSGKQIVVITEQGLGDTLQFLRFVPMLKAQGADKVLLELPPELAVLFPNIEGVDELIVVNEGENQSVYFHTYSYLLSLPEHLDIGLENIPRPQPKVYLEPERQQYWQSKLETQTLHKVGLVWSGRPEFYRNERRSFNFARYETLISAHSQIQFYSLQKGVAEEQTQTFSSSNFKHLSPEITSFMDTASIIEQLDLVITVDTSVAHLAGLMGKPVWILLSKDCDWRWLMDRADSPWYPSARLFRQQTMGDWGSVFQNVQKALESFKPNPL